MKKVIYLVLAVLVIIGVVALTKKSPSQEQVETTPAPASSTTVKSETVTYTNTGYSPATITVTAGTKVVFVNNSDSPMWTASDPHPIHTGLKGFDSKKAAGKSQAYEFTFTEAGTFSYHNHLSPEHTGTIVVTN